MQKLVILIDPTFNEQEFDLKWPEFLALAERMPGLVREATSRVENILYGQFEYGMVHELYFEDMDQMKAALASETGRMAGKRLQEITKGRVVLFYANHTEDSAENLARYQESQDDNGTATPDA